MWGLVRRETPQCDVSTWGLPHPVGVVEPVGVIKRIVELAGFVIAVDETSYCLSHDPCPMRFLCSQHAFFCYLVGLHHCCFLVVRHSADKGTLAFAGKNHFSLFFRPRSDDNGLVLRQREATEVKSVAIVGVGFEIMKKWVFPLEKRQVCFIFAETLTFILACVLIVPIGRRQGDRHRLDEDGERHSGGCTIT